MLDVKACLYFAEIEDELIFTDFYIYGSTEWNEKTTNSGSSYKDSLG